MGEAGMDVARLNEAVKAETLIVQAAVDEVRKVIVGQRGLVERMMIALLCRGHLLLEGVPGLAKTLAVRTLAQVLDAALLAHPVHARPPAGRPHRHARLPAEDRRVRRAQGAGLREPRARRRDQPRARQGPVGAARGDAGAAGHDRRRDPPLPEPFLVLATQNPIEQEGTYPLPEAQVDRFLLKVKVDYPTKAEERQILDRMSRGEVPERQLASSSAADVLRLARLVRSVYVDERMRDYIVDLVHATRRPKEVGLPELVPLIAFGASPRATLAFSEAARAHAFLRGRGYVVPEDVKEIARDVLRHRVLLTYEAEAENVTAETVVDRVLERVEVP